MKVQTIPVNDFQENCHIAWNEQTRETAIIDCGANSTNEFNKIRQFISENNLKPRYALLTHCHFDHIMGLGFLHNTYGLTPMYHTSEQDIFLAMPEMAAQFGIKFPTQLPQDFLPLTDNQELALGTEHLKIIHTPGHTPGGVCIYCQESNILFSGDTLFRGSLGRTDLGGNMDQELNSIRSRILTLPNQTIIHTGHGPSTSVMWEKENNPYVGTRKDFFF